MLRLVVAASFSSCNADFETIFSPVAEEAIVSTGLSIRPSGSREDYRKIEHK